MAERRLDLQAIELIALFERFTRVPAIDYVVTAQVAYFVVPRGSMGRLKENQGLEHLGRKLGKTVRLIEAKDDPVEFLHSLFWHYGVEEARCEEGPEGMVGRVKVSPLRKGRAIGKGGENLKALRELAKRHIGLGTLYRE